MKSTLLFCCIYFLASCGETSLSEKNKATVQPIHSKPGSTYTDSVRIGETAAVFYEPDSLQLQKISAVTDKGIFASAMHEFFYQQRNAHRFLKQYWPRISILEVKKFRYILFEKKDGTTETIDLDKLADACGMFIFKPDSTALRVDMMNVETQVSQYFRNK